MGMRIWFRRFWPALVVCAILVVGVVLIATETPGSEWWLLGLSAAYAVAFLVAMLRRRRPERAVVDAAREAQSLTLGPGSITMPEPGPDASEIRER